MSDLWGRLRRLPGHTALMVLASILANLLGLASSLYVIQVLNRYVSHGVDATLVTLTVGVVLAILFELGFRWSRMRLAAVASAEPDYQMAVGAYGILTTAKLSALDKVPTGDRREALQGLEQVETAYSAPNLTAIMDLPFALIFVLAIFMISPSLAGIVLVAIVLVAALGLANQITLRPLAKQIGEHQSVGHGLISTTASTAESVRAFGAGKRLITDWAENLSAVQALRRRFANRQGGIQSLTQSIQGMMSAGVIAFGAVLVVAGDLDVGMMIGANLLAARALQPVTRVAQLSEALVKSKQGKERALALAALPVEAGSGAALRAYSGTIEFRDIAYTPPNAPTPLFEDLTLDLPSGAVVALKGKNGAGKTTLLRLIAGLIDPDRGQVLADGVDLRQIVPDWWRSQIVYLPQEPTFINASIRDNLKLTNPDITDEALEALLERAGVANYVHETEFGLNTILENNGMTLSRGVRRRLAMARALASGGKLVLFDEPTEGMDDEGTAKVHETLTQLVRAGRTIIVSTHDPNILKDVQIRIDLDRKPTPDIVPVRSAEVSSGDPLPSVSAKPQTNKRGAGKKGPSKRPPIKRRAAE